MTAKKLEAILKNLTACKEGYKWANGKTLKQAWETCQHEDWMMWLYKYASPKKDVCVRIAVHAAESCIANWVNKYPDDNRPQLAIQSAKDWLENPSVASAESAASAASAARSAKSSAWSAESTALAVLAASVASAARSAKSSASAALAAESAAWSAAWSAARSAELAASAAWSAAWSAASAESAASAAWSEQADYIRTFITWKDIEQGLEARHD